MNKKNLKKIFFPLKTGRYRFFNRNETASSPLNPMVWGSLTPTLVTTVFSLYSRFTNLLFMLSNFMYICTPACTVPSNIANETMMNQVLLIGFFFQEFHRKILHCDHQSLIHRCFIRHKICLTELYFQYTYPLSNAGANAYPFD